jgi:2-polyprenyl-6-methoxyphenol hydroxylase-like FAD-dependent oxidoreductase
METLIIGAGIGGLTLALSLHQAGIPCRVFESVGEIKPLGVGINLLPHAVRELTELGLQPALAKRAVETRELCFYNRHGQFIHSEPRGRFAGYDWPQLSIHRAELHRVLLDAAQQRLGTDRIHLDHKCLGVEQDASGVTATFLAGGGARPIRGATAIGCDGIHSVVRRELYPGEGPPIYSGVTMWRGLTYCRPFLTGASMLLAGSLRAGKVVAYPIASPSESDGRQLVNWLAELRMPTRRQQDWTCKGKLADFLWAYEDWSFDWLDVPALFRDAEIVLEYPMVDRDPIPQWSFGRISLLGDAAHPMYPVGSNGAGQAILDARTLAGCLKRTVDEIAALKAYEQARAKPIRDLILLNRSNPPDAILEQVDRRTSGRPFGCLDEVISNAEMSEMCERYKRVAGFDIEGLRTRPSLA